MSEHRFEPRLLAAVLASVTGSGIAWGTLVPLMTLQLERQGVSATVIGLQSAMSVLAVMTTVRLLVPLARSVGVVNALIGGVLIEAVLIVLLSVFRSVEAWFLLRFLIGITGGLHWVLSETWINSLAPPARRGFYVGIYGALFMLGFAIGPILLTVLPTNDVLPFYLVAGGVLIAIVPIYFARHHLPPLDDEHSRSSYAALVMAPTLFFAVLATGLADSALWSLLPVYGIDKGLNEARALLLLTALNVGTVALQIPLGMLTDRGGTRPLLIACATLGVVGSLVLPSIVTQDIAVWVMLFVWGGTVAGLYTIALAELGVRFRGTELAQANGLFVSCYSLGGLVGPPLAGSLIDRTGPDGLPMLIAVIYGAVAVFASYRWVLRRGTRR